MAIIDRSLLELITANLSLQPNPAIDPKLWVELSRVQGGLRETAALIDRINNNPKTTIVGNPETMDYSDFLNQQTQVRFRASGAIASGQLVRLGNSGGELIAIVAPPNVRCNGYATTAVANGAYGFAVMRGFVFSTIFVGSVTLANAESRLCVSSDSGTSVGRFLTCGSTGGSAGTADKYAGQVVQANVVGANAAAIYFNPDSTF